MAYIAIQDGRGETLYCAIVWAMKGIRGVPKQGGCLRIIVLIRVQRPRTQRMYCKQINRSHTHTDREQHPRHRHTRTRQEHHPNPPNKHLAQEGRTLYAALSVCVCSVWVPCVALSSGGGSSAGSSPLCLWVGSSPVVFLFPVASVPRLASRSCSRSRSLRVNPNPLLGSTHLPPRPNPVRCT